MAGSRCPYHVKHGLVDESGEFVLRNICGVKTSGGADCGLFPFEETCYRSCSRYMAQQSGGERQVMLPKDDLEYRPEFGGNTSLSDMELM
jgi:hypothetical protein